MPVLAQALAIYSAPVYNSIENRREVGLATARDAKRVGIEAIYQTLALADNLSATANIFFGREIVNGCGMLNEARMERDAISVIKRLNPNLQNFHSSVGGLSGGQRQAVAIARTLQFNAKIIIMDEPTAALGPQETQMVGNLIRQLNVKSFPTMTPLFSTRKMLI